MSHTLKVWNSCRKKFELNMQTDIWYLEDENCRIVKIMQILLN